MTSIEQQHYHDLHRISRKARVLSGIGMLLEWDQETMMPPGAADARSDQMELIASLSHRVKTSPEFEEALSKLIDLETGLLRVEQLSEAQKAAIRVWRRDYIKAKCLPVSFVEKFAKLTSQATQIWRIAKQDNTFSIFQPYLDRIIEACREKAEYLGYIEHPYDALLDEYEPGFTTQEVNTLFGSLKTSIVDLLGHLNPEFTKEANSSIIEVNEKELNSFLRMMLDCVKFDWDIARLDASSHPFSSSYHPTDNRITIRAHSKDVLDQILTTLHEAGHSFYEMGLPAEHYGSPLAEAVSLGMHESQSRWWETLIGRSRPFWSFFYAKLQASFNSQFAQISIEEFLHKLNHVQKSFIRTQADEVTYPLHVILRFEIEKELIEGKIKAKDVPERWNCTLKELLGIVPPNDRLGCLQDIHWSMGSLGYFPTYSLGNIYAAQLFEAFSHRHPDWERRVSLGDFGFIRQWLTDNIHSLGRQYYSKDLIYKITNKPLSSEAYIRYLNNKYRSVC